MCLERNREPPLCWFFIHHPIAWACTQTPMRIDIAAPRDTTVSCDIYSSSTAVNYCRHGRKMHVPPPTSSHHRTTSFVLRWRSTNTARRWPQSRSSVTVHNDDSRAWFVILRFCTKQMYANTPTLHTRPGLWNTSAISSVQIFAKF